MARQVFTSSGTFSVPASVTEVNVLIIGGGGSGGRAGSSGGGGGAGGVRYLTAVAVSGDVAVVVGAGGTPPGSTNTGGAGDDSSFGALIATGGGGGGGGASGPAAAGGSGGGGPSSATPAGGAGTAGQGYAGGTGLDGTNSQDAGGGGGGAGSIGADATNSIGGNGGDGIDVTTLDSQLINLGIANWVAGGGGGGVRWSGFAGGTGGNGGGGAGGDSVTVPTPGAVNTGSGGGGSTTTSGSIGTEAAEGGSGLVVVLWGNDDPTLPMPVDTTSTVNLSNPAMRAGKSQHWQWWTGARWDGVLPTVTGWRLYTDITGTPVQGAIIDSRQDARVDTLFYNDTLWVLRGHTTTPLLTRYNFDGDTYVADIGVTDISISTLAVTDHDASPAVLHRTSNGRLWSAVVNGVNCVVAISDDDGATWPTSNVFAVSATGVVCLSTANEQVVLVVVLNDSNGRFVRTIAQDTTDILPASWATEALPALPGGITSDDHGDVTNVQGHIYMTSKTTGAVNSSQPLLYMLHRTPDGQWASHTIRPGPDAGETRLVVIGYYGWLRFVYGSYVAPTYLSALTVDRYTLTVPSSTTLFGFGDFSDSAVMPRTVTVESGLLLLANERVNGVIWRVLESVDTTGTGVIRGDSVELKPYTLTSGGLKETDSSFIKK